MAGKSVKINEKGGRIVCYSKLSFAALCFVLIEKEYVGLFVKNGAPYALNGLAIA